MATNVSSLPDVVDDNDANHNGHHELIHKRLKELNSEIENASKTAEWGGITGQPNSYPPEDHEHDIEDVVNLQAELDAKAKKSPATSITSAPEYLGQISVVSGAAYIAVGTLAAADWKKITN